MRLYYLFIIVLLSNCKQNNCKQSKDIPETKDVVWTTCSNYMGDTNMIIDLPNIVKLKSALEDPCQGDPRKLIMYYTCIMNKDTSNIEIESSIFIDYLLNHKVQDTTRLYAMSAYLLSTYSQAQINLKKIKEINGENFYIVKYNIKQIPYCWIKFVYRSNVISIKIENIKEENIINKIIESFKFEEKRSFMCF